MRPHLGHIGYVAGDLGECGCQHAEGRGEGDEITDLDGKAAGKEVDDQQADHTHHRQQRRIDTQLELGIVDDMGGMRVAAEPLGVGTRLRASELDLLDTRKQVALHAVEGIVLADKPLLHTGNGAEVKHRQQCLDDIQYGCWQQELSAIDAHLDEIDDGEHAPQQCADNRLVDLLAEQGEVTHLGGQFTAAVFMEESGRQEKQSRHDGIVHVHLQYVFHPDDIEIAKIGEQHDGYCGTSQQSGYRSQGCRIASGYHGVEYKLVGHRDQHA